MNVDDEQRIAVDRNDLGNGNWETAGREAWYRDYCWCTEVYSVCIGMANTIWSY